LTKLQSPLNFAPIIPFKQHALNDLEKLIYTMKEAHKLATTEEKPDFMEEDWIQAAIKELDSSNLDPEQRAILEVTVAREMSNRHAAELWEKFIKERAETAGFNKGMEKGMQKGVEKGRYEQQLQIIRELLLQTELSDSQIAGITGSEVALVAEIRGSM
jgi:flagellar biosynthesis/type III secretory pathway protein FliH